MTNEEPRLDRIERLVEANATQIAQTQRQVDLNSQTIQQLLQIQRQTFERSESEMDSIRAAIDRIDRIMDYLMNQRRDYECKKPCDLRRSEGFVGIKAEVVEAFNTTKLH